MEINKLKVVNLNSSKDEVLLRTLVKEIFTTKEGDAMLQLLKKRFIFSHTMFGTAMIHKIDPMYLLGQQSVITYLGDILEQKRDKE